jgi:hypothetical protein
VHVKVAEQDSVGPRGCSLLTRSTRADVLGRERDARDLAVDVWIRTPIHEPKSQNEEDQAENDRQTALFPPSHAAGSIGRDRGESR